MKTKSVKSDDLILWNPHQEGESVLGRFEKVIDTDNGQGLILDTGSLKLFVPVWAVLKDTKTEVEKAISEGNDDVFILLSYLGTKESPKGTYKRISSHLMIPQTEDEVDECFTLCAGNDLQEDEKGYFSEALIQKGAFLTAFEYLGYENPKKLLE